jgi:hypothetical protein
MPAGFRLASAQNFTKIVQMGHWRRSCALYGVLQRVTLDPRRRPIVAHIFSTASTVSSTSLRYSAQYSAARMVKSPAATGS